VAMTAQPQVVMPQLGAFGAYGGRYAPELLWHALAELADAHQRIVPSLEFQRAFRRELRTWGGRPTPLTAVLNFSAWATRNECLQLEELSHGGADKPINVIGQALLARRLGMRG